MPRYSPLTNKLFPWMYHVIDRYMCGHYDTAKGGPRPFLTVTEIERLKNGKNPAFWRKHKLTKTQGQKHLDHSTILYYRSKEACKYMLVVLDIDAKKKFTEAQTEACAAYISKSIHRKTYYEPSTKGEGRHLYLLIDKGPMDNRQWKDLFARYLVALRVLIDRKKTGGAIDRICGQPTIVSRWANEKCEHQWRIYEGDCGILAKIPTLPNGFESLEWLMRSPILKAQDFQKVIDRVQKYDKPAKPTKENRGKKDRDTYTVPSTHTPIIDMRTKFGSHRYFLIENIKTESDAFRRTHLACSNYIITHKAFPPSPLRLMEFYEYYNLHTGMGEDDRKRRLARCSSVLRFQKDHRSEDTLDVCGYQPKEYLELVKANVTLEHFEEIKCDREITPEDLAACLYLMERNATVRNSQNRWQGTTGVEAIMSLFRVLKEAKVLPRGCNRNQASAMRRILVKSGLISLEDDHYRFLGRNRGVCKKYGVGPNNPKHAYYLNFTTSLKETYQQMTVTTMPVIEVSEKPVNCRLPLPQGAASQPPSTAVRFPAPEAYDGMVKRAKMDDDALL